MRTKIDDLTKLLYRLWNDYDKNPIPDKSKSRSNDLKERFIKKLASMVGVNSAHVNHDRKYSVDDLQMDFFKYLNSSESKCEGSIKELFALAAKESSDTDAGSAESAENQRSHVAE